MKNGLLLTRVKVSTFYRVYSLENYLVVDISGLQFCDT